MKSVLMVALDFPPCKSAGVQRTLKFIEYLPSHGWNPSVLTAKAMIYDAVEKTDHYPDIPIYRALGWNTLKHFSIKGKHLDYMLKPDRFFSWYWHGVMLGKKAILEQKPDLIWSTFPSSTAMKIACRLKQISGLPWIADFRDPFAGVNPQVNQNNNPGQRVDKAVIESADKLVFSTNKTAELYLSFYPALQADNVHVITNGFNDEEFKAAYQRVGYDPRPKPLKLLQTINQSGSENSTSSRNSKKLILLHSGFLYPEGRDPNPLIDALVQLKQESPDIVDSLRVHFRGAQASSAMQEKLACYGLSDTVEFLPPISYQASIDEMLQSDALLLLQGEVFNTQIPGKAYEYLRSGKPMLVLSPDASATVGLLKSHPGVFCADLADSKQIADRLQALLNSETYFERDIQKYSRRATCEQLASVMNELF